MTKYAKIPLTELKVGAKARGPIYDPADDGVLLLSAGTVITKSQIEKIHGRGISEVKVQETELARVSHVDPKVIRIKQVAEKLLENSSEAKPFDQNVVKHGTNEYKLEDVQEANELFQGTVDQTKHVFESLADGQSVDGAAVIASTTTGLDQMAADLDLFVSLGMKPTEDNSLYQHSVQTCRLAVAIGATMKLTQTELMDLGIGCMVHDVGMMKVPKEIVESTEVLTAVEFLEVQKHPIYTFEMIKNIPELPQGGSHGGLPAA